MTNTTVDPSLFCFYSLCNQIPQKKHLASLAEKRRKYTGLWLSYHKAKEVEKEKTRIDGTRVISQLVYNVNQILRQGCGQERHGAGIDQAAKHPPPPLDKKAGKKRGGVEKG